MSAFSSYASDVPNYISIQSKSWSLRSPTELISKVVCIRSDCLQGQLNLLVTSHRESDSRVTVLIKQCILAVIYIK